MGGLKWWSDRRRGEWDHHQQSVWDQFQTRQHHVVAFDFTLVACYENASTVDGCYSEVELEVPSPSEALEGLTR